ncbi:MAG: 4-hydroxybutyrate CoA-transferase [Actinomycetia bacterium]|nr:4-hydroxybutyrate CoA-transferase [Actinomycetes bacterium]
MKIVKHEHLAAAVSRLPPNPRVLASGNFATPNETLFVLDSLLPEYVLHILNAQPGIPARAGVIHETAFVGPGMRNSPTLRYVPCRLSLVPVLLSRIMPPDLVVIQTSAPRDGMVSLGIEVNVLPAGIEATRARGGIVVAQVNPQMPFTYGDAVLHTDEIDFGVEVDMPIATAASPALDDTARLIGERVAYHVQDGATLQLGIGAVPDAVLAGLAQRHDLRVWSEMFSDGVLDLVERGSIDHEVPLTASFVFGSRAVYDFVDLNKSVHMMRTEVTNDPTRISQQRAMTAINSAIQVDLSAQANASRINGRIYSGFGGSTDFIVGALHSAGGQAFIALPSWHPKANQSTIVPLIAEPVTSFQHSAIVTEQGIAYVFGRTEAEQTRQIIECAAHPKARGELRAVAADMGRM